MNKLLYLQLNRPAFLQYKLDRRAARSMGRIARYAEKLNLLSSIHAAIAPKVEQLWKNADESEEIGTFNQFKSANRRKTDINGRGSLNSCEGAGFKVHSTDEFGMLKFAEDKEKREVEISVE